MKIKFAVLLKVSGYFKGTVRIDPVDWYKDHPIGEVRLFYGDELLRLDDVELDILFPSDDQIKEAVAAGKEVIKTAKLEQLRKQMEELEGAA